jgi:hypothetical protein
MGFGFPATGGGWAVAASGGLKPSDAARSRSRFRHECLKQR